MPCEPCPLCATHNTSTPSSSPVLYHQDKRRDYWQCERCKLVFVSADQRPTLSQEQQEYALHDNNPDDPGYQRFLMKAATPLMEKLPPSARHGLDFGCGPAPALARLLEAQGYHMAVYDPLFSPDTSVFNRTYDFVTCTEAIEHFHTPDKELTLLSGLVAPGGWLCIMTKRVIDQARFASWHYKNDPTHVSFFSDATFDYIGRYYGFDVHLVASDVVLMNKHSYNTQL